jgi:hypothetical protein
MSDRDIVDDAWFGEINRAIKGATAGIMCVTRENYDRPWILYEAGGLVATCGRGGVFPFLLDMKPPELDGLNYPLYPLESYFFDRGGVFHLVSALNRKLEPESKTENEVEKDFNSAWPELESQLRAISQAVPFFSYLLAPERYRVQRTPSWESLYLSIVAKHVSKSPFQFADLIAQASSEILISGQNLFWLTADKDKKENIDNKGLVFQAINDGKKLRIMLCDPTNGSAIQTWGGDVMRNRELYAEHLDHSITTLRKWVREANNLNAFEVKTIGMVPVSITFVDPDPKIESGKLVLTTATYERKRAETRPCYLILKKEHHDIFTYYLDAYEWAYKEWAALLV